MAGYPACQIRLLVKMYIASTFLRQLQVIGFNIPHSFNGKRARNIFAVNEGMENLSGKSFSQLRPSIFYPKKQISSILNISLVEGGKLINSKVKLKLLQCKRSIFICQKGSVQPKIITSMFGTRKNVPIRFLSRVFTAKNVDLRTQIQ